MTKLPKFLATWVNARTYRKQHKTLRASNGTNARKQITKKGRLNIKIVKVSETFV